MTRARRLLAGLLSILTVAFAPGLAPYQAVASTINAGAARAASASRAPSVPRVGAGAVSAPLSRPGVALSLPTASPRVQAVEAGLPALGAAASAASVSLAAEASAAPAAADSRPVLSAPSASPASVSAELGSAAELASSEKSDASRSSASRFFDGARALAVRALQSPARAFAPKGHGDKLFTATPQAASASVSVASRGLAAPTRVALEGKGLDLGDRFLSPASQDGPPAPKKPDLGGLPEAQQKKAIWGLTANRFFSLVAGSIGGIAYPLMVIAAVGQATFYDLSGLGSLIGIPLSLVAGNIGDKMTAKGRLKGYTIFNIGLRAGISVVQAVFFVNGWLTFWPLMVLTALSSWQFSTLFSNDSAVQAEVVGRDKDKMRSTEALIRMTTIGVTVVSGLFLGAAAVASLGYASTFLLVAAIQALALPFMHYMLPKFPARARKAAASVKTAGEKARAAFTLKNFGKAALLAASIGFYFMPLAGALALVKSVPVLLVSAALIWGTKGMRTIRGNPVLKATLLFVTIGAFIEVPLRNSVLGVLASEVMPDKASAAAYLGSLVAAFYLGQMPSGTGMLDKGLTVAGKPFRQVMKWVGSAGVAAWVYFVLLPKGTLAGLVASGLAAAPAGAVAAMALFMGLVGVLLYHGARSSELRVPDGWPLKANRFLNVVGRTMVLGGGAVAAVALAVAAFPGLALPLAIAALVAGVFAGYFRLHDMSPKLSDRKWMKLEAGALLMMGTPLLFGLAPWSLYLSLAAFGFVLNGSQRMVSSEFATKTKEIAPDNFQEVGGARNAMFNIATALAYTVYGLAKRLPDYWGDPNAFPFTWYVIAATFSIFAVLFWRGAASFSDLSPEDRKKQRQTPPPAPPAAK